MSIRQIVAPYLNRWTLAGAIAVAAILLITIGIYLSWVKTDRSSADQPTAVIAVIPAPTATSSPTPTPSVTGTPEADIPPSPLPGTLGIGGFVQISGTGGDGLRLRTNPGLSYEVAYLGLEAEVFQVVGGPQESDGYTWWLLESPYDEGQKRQGWAVSNYILPIQNP